METSNCFEPESLGRLSGRLGMRQSVDCYRVGGETGGVCPDERTDPCLAIVVAVTTSATRERVSNKGAGQILRGGPLAYS